MYTLNPMVLQRCLSYKELFGKEQSDEEIKAYVQSLNMYNSISIICELLSLRDKTIKKTSSYLWWDIDLTIPFDNVLKSLLLEYCDNHKVELTEEAKSLLNPFSREAKLITLQSLLHAMKILLAYGNYEWIDSRPQIEKEEYAKTIILALISIDLLSVEDIRPDHFIYGNYQLNQFNNVGNEICRAYYMYCMIGASSAFLPDSRRDQWININEDFVSKYGYSISQYLATVILLVEKELSDQDKLSFCPIYFDMETAFSKTNHPDCSKAVITDLSVNPQEIQPWAENTLRSWWDYSEFLEHPIMYIPSGKCISLCDKTIVNSLYNNLYWRLRNCYPQSDTTIISYIGELFCFR